MGLSIARNHGIAEARGEIVAFTDDDCEAPEDWLSAIHDAFKRYPGVGVVVGSLVRPKHEPSRAFSVCPEVVASELLYDPAATGTSAPERWGAAGGNFAFRREVLDAVGPFDELLGAGAPFPATEDTDYLIRVEALGWQMYSTPTLVIHHTYGYGMDSAVYRLKGNYALGNGALAARLSLSGDRAGPSGSAQRYETRPSSRFGGCGGFDADAAAAARVLHARLLRLSKRVPHCERACRPRTCRPRTRLALSGTGAVLGRCL